LVYWPSFATVNAEWKELVEEVGTGVEKVIWLWERERTGADTMERQIRWNMGLQELKKERGNGLSQHSGSSSRRKATTSGSKERSSKRPRGTSERRDGGRVSWHALDGKVAKVISFPDKGTKAPGKTSAQ